MTEEVRSEKIVEMPGGGKSNTTKSNPNSNITKNSSYHILKQYFTVGIVAVLLGNSVPSNYNQNPESFLYVSMLIIILLGLWGSSLGTSKLNHHNVCIRHRQKGLKGHSSHITAITISSGLQPKIISASCDSTVRVWEFLTGAHLLTYVEHHCRVLCVAISSSDIVFSGGLNHFIHVWDVHTGQTLRILTGHNLSVCSMSISNSSSLCAPTSVNVNWSFQNYSNSILASGGEDGRILVWNATSYDLVCDLTHPTRGPTVAVVSICLSKSQSTLLLSGDTCGTIALWNLLTQQVLHIFEGHFGPVTSLVLYESTDKHYEESSSPSSSSPSSHDSDPILVSSSADWTIRIWNLTTKKLLNILEGHSGGVECLALYTPSQRKNYTHPYSLTSSSSSPSSSKMKSYPLIISGGRDETIRVWDLQTGVLYRNLEDHTDTVYNVTVSTTDTIQMIISGITSMAIFVNQTRSVIISGGADCSLQLWNLDKIIYDINWERRKSFGQFIYFLRHCKEIYFYEQQQHDENVMNGTIKESSSSSSTSHLSVSEGTSGHNNHVGTRRITSAKMNSFVQCCNMDDICYLIAAYL